MSRLVSGCILVLALVGCGGADPPARTARVPIPDPEVADADPPVREKIAAARTSLRRSPDSAGAWGRLGMVLDAHGLFAPAVVCYRQAAALDPGDGRWPYLAGIVLAVDDPVEAITLLERAAALTPDSAVLLETYGDALLRAGRPGEARRRYERALAIDPQSRKALLGLGELALRDGALDEALARLQQAAELEFCDREVHARLARVHRRLGDTDSARRETLLVRAYPDLAPVSDPVRALVTAEAVSAKAYGQRGLRALAGGRLDEAEQSFRLALDLNAASVRNHLNLAGVLVRQGRTGEAMTYFEDALALDDRDPEVHNNLAVALMELGRLDEAQDHLRTALQLDPDHDEAQFNVGTILHQRGAVEEAVTAYHHALEINPVNVPAHLALARLHAARGNTEAAVDHWRRASAFGCYEPEATANLAMAEARRGRFDHASVLLRQGLARAPDHEPMLAAAATIFATCPSARYRNGAEAVRLANRLVELNGSEHVPTLNLLAAALAESRDFEGAIEVSRQALEVARRRGEEDLAAVIERRLDLLRSGRPLHQPANPAGN